jgi:hypothetical protein
VKAFSAEYILKTKRHYDWKFVMTYTSNQPNPILAQFRAAARLANEWRDTITYTAGTVVAAYETMKTGSATGTLVCMWARETSRFLAWRFGNDEKQIVGAKTIRKDKNKLSTAALAGAWAILLSENLLRQATGIGHLDLLAGSDAMFLTFITGIAGGPREVLKAYAETMWDYPREKGGGGTTQTQKLHDGLSDMIQSIVGGLAPQPVAINARETLVQAKPLKIA